MDVPRRPDKSARMQDVEFGTALLAALGVGSIAFELRREAVPLWRLFIAPLAALAAVLALPPEPDRLVVVVAGLLAGIVAGSLRGFLTPLRVDHIWKVVRLRRAAYDGVAFALAIAVLAGADTKPTVAFLLSRMVSVPFAAVAFFAAGYLLGRAVTIGLRTRSTPHDDMRPGAA
jgi:hypothetical protein